MSGYRVSFSKSAIKELKKLDKNTSRIIKNWIAKNLTDTTDPRQHGKELKGKLKGVWRYRVGDYRLFAEIRDREVMIFIFEIAHRKECYKKQ